MDLRAEILAKCSPEVVASRNDGAIAAAVSVGRIRRVPMEIGNRTILEAIGLTAGNALLDVLNTAPDFRHVKPLLEQGRLRVDSELVRATLEALVPQYLTQANAYALKALAVVPDPVSVSDVSNALNGA